MKSGLLDCLMDGLDVHGAAKRLPRVRLFRGHLGAFLFFKLGVLVVNYRLCNTIGNDYANL